jgi:hypothetical protein
MYLHVDDPPFKKLPLRSPWLCREIKRRTISLVGFGEIAIDLREVRFWIVSGLPTSM